MSSGDSVLSTVAFWQPAPSFTSAKTSRQILKKTTKTSDLTLLAAWPNAVQYGPFAGFTRYHQMALNPLTLDIVAE